MGSHPDPLWFNPSCCFIDNQWVPPGSGQTLELLNPSDASVIGCIARGNHDDVNKAVASAQQALQGEWGQMTAPERGRILTQIGQRVLAKADQMAQLESLDVGKPLAQAKADVVALARYMEFYGGAADKIHGSTIPYLEGYTVYTLREPHGVTAHIIPWNYPMQIIGRSVGAALAMGNATVLKPAEQACLTALAFAELARDAGLPGGALNVVPGLGDEAGAALSLHPSVHHISFTGSVGVGRSIQHSAADNIVPVTLELGGKSPQLVFDDADIDTALPYLVNAGIQNAGQTCSAASRILVHKAVHEQVLEKMSVSYNALRVGTAMDDLHLGPLISAKQLATVKQFMDKADDLQLAAQGQINDDVPEAGFYMAPTLFNNVPPEHVLAQQEIFGPVQMIIPFNNEEEALAIANGTDFALVASVWTDSGARQMRLARQLRAGQVFINNYGAGGGVELPFGGTGLSGHGREKGFEALYGFSTLKTVAARHG